MNAYIAAVRSQGHHGQQQFDVLLGQHNIYVPPHPSFQYAGISPNAAQWVLPGGAVEPGETVEAAALREFVAATGVCRGWHPS